MVVQSSEFEFPKHFTFDLFRTINRIYPPPKKKYKLDINSAQIFTTYFKNIFKPGGEGGGDDFSATCLYTFLLNSGNGSLPEFFLGARSLMSCLFWIELLAPFPVLVSEMLDPRSLAVLYTEELALLWLKHEIFYY